LPELLPLFDNGEDGSGNGSSFSGSSKRSGSSSSRSSKRRKATHNLATFKSVIPSLSPPTLDIPRVNVTICRAIVVGTIAFQLPPNESSDYKTHKWYVYVRGMQCEDLSYFVSRVAFSLHGSFNPPIRSIDKPPYEVQEFGWGEFSIGVRIHFKDRSIPPVDTVHMLKLYPPANLKPNPKKPVLSEQYDEIVFNNPPTAFYKLLMDGPQIEPPRHPLTDFFGNFNEIYDLKRIREAQAYVDKELSSVKQKIEEKAIENKLGIVGDVVGDVDVDIHMGDDVVDDDMAEISDMLG